MIVIDFSGDLDVGRFSEFHARFEQAVSEPPPVLVDLSNVRIVDSTFLSELLVFVRRRQAVGKKVGVLITSADLGRIFAITNLEHRMNVYYDRASAERELTPQT